MLRLKLNSLPAETTPTLYLNYIMLRLKLYDITATVVGLVTFKLHYVKIKTRKITLFK